MMDQRLRLASSVSYLWTGDMLGEGDGQRSHACLGATMSQGQDIGGWVGHYWEIRGSGKGGSELRSGDEWMVGVSEGERGR